MLDYKLLREVQAGFSKKAFVQMPGKSAQDAGMPADAMGGMPPDAMGGGMPPDAMGGVPPDAAGAAPAPMPPPGLDAAMAGMVGGGAPMPPADPGAPAQAQFTGTLDDVAKFMQKVLAIKSNGGLDQPQNNDMAEIRQALTQIAAQMRDGGAIA